MSSAAEIITGRCAVWPLPHTSECARAARGRVREVVADLLPERFYDCLEMASELATNAWLHGLGGRTLDGDDAPAAGRSELAIYRRGADPGAELVVTVFDPCPDLTAIPAPAPNVLAGVPDKRLNESPPPEVLDAVLALLPDREPVAATAGLPPQRWSGRRGLDAVRQLSGGRCGFRRARSQLGAECVSGKVAWFALPISAGSRAARPPVSSLRPAEAGQALESQLVARGVHGIIRRVFADQSVLSIPGITVWCRDQYFSWGSGKQAIRLSTSDFVDAVEQIIGITEDHRHITSLQLSRMDQIELPRV